MQRQRRLITRPVPDEDGSSHAASAGCLRTFVQQRLRVRRLTCHAALVSSMRHVWLWCLSAEAAGGPRHYFRRHQPSTRQRSPELSPPLEVLPKPAQQSQAHLGTTSGRATNRTPTRKTPCSSARLLLCSRGVPVPLKARSKRAPARSNSILKVRSQLVSQETSHARTPSKECVIPVK